MCFDLLRLYLYASGKTECNDIEMFLLKSRSLCKNFGVGLGLDAVQPSRYFNTFERKSQCLPLVQLRLAYGRSSLECYMREDRQVLPDVRLSIAAFRKVPRLRPLV